MFHQILFIPEDRLVNPGFGGSRLLKPAHEIGHGLRAALKVPGHGSVSGVLDPAPDPEFQGLRPGVSPEEDALDFAEHFEIHSPDLAGTAC